MTKKEPKYPNTQETNEPLLVEQELEQFAKDVHGHWMVEDSGKPFDLEERTALFGEGVIEFARKIPQDAVTQRLIGQLVGVGKSVGANYCEADDSVSRKEYKQKVGYCKKEARETKFFIRMIVKAVPALREEAMPLWQEAKELHLIFAKIYRA